MYKIISTISKIVLVSLIFSIFLLTYLAFTLTELMDFISEINENLPSVFDRYEYNHDFQTIGDESLNYSNTTPKETVHFMESNNGRSYNGNNLEESSSLRNTGNNRYYTNRSIRHQYLTEMKSIDKSLGYLSHKLEESKVIMDRIEELVNSHNVERKSSLYKFHNNISENEKEIISNELSKSSKELTYYNKGINQQEKTILKRIQKMESKFNNLEEVHQKKHKMENEIRIYRERHSNL